MKRREHFISWKESAAFANKVEMLLEDLEVGVEDPRTGVELVAAFYMADSTIIEQCDDSYGNVGHVFQFSAKQLFVCYASKCLDQEWLVELLFHLNYEDNYGIRDILVNCAGEYLSETMIRKLINKFQTAANGETDEFKKNHLLWQVESLARQVKDAPLFEEIRFASRGTLSSGDFVDITRVYLESGDAEKALSWIQVTLRVRCHLPC